MDQGRAVGALELHQEVDLDGGGRRLDTAHLGPAEPGADVDQGEDDEDPRHAGILAETTPRAGALGSSG